MSEVEPVTFCPKCGARSEGGRFCRSCGTNLGAISEAISKPGRRSGTSVRSTGTATLAVFNPAYVSNAEGQLGGHSACSVFGPLVLDFCATPLPAGETKISIYTVFGPCLILVPEDLPVRLTGAAVFGPVKVRREKIRRGGVIDTSEYVSTGYYQSAQRLHIDASTLFGPVTIGAPGELSRSERRMFEKLKRAFEKVRR